MSFKKSCFIDSKVHVKITPGEVLKIMRQLQGLSQSKLKIKTGLSQPNISALENGTVQMGRINALKLAYALNVHPAVLMFPDYDVQQAA